MCKAIEQARLGLGLTSPNPPVGSVIVFDGNLIGEGYHHGPGLPHAEREAIADACEKGNRELLQGATMYITLEPCSTHGRTPPCTDAIIDHGIKRVIFGVEDPNPDNARRAFGILENEGVQVECGLMEKECSDLIRPFATALVKGRPWIVAKTAMTLDGRITRATHFPQWFTGLAAKKYVHTVRSLSDAILIGGETLRRDDPALTVRTPDRPIFGQKKQPWRFILTRDRQNLPENSQCFTDPESDRTVIVEDVVDFERFVSSLVHEYGIHTLMLECGGNLLRQFLEKRLVDEWIGFYAPLINGGNDFGVGVAPGLDFMPFEARLDEVTYLQFDRDMCIQGLVSYHE